MTVIEEKSLKAQIELYKGIDDANNMILYTINKNASEVLNDIINTKPYNKEGQTTVELTLEEYEKIRAVLTQFSTEDRFYQMSSWLKEKYIDPKKEKQKILSMLQ